MALEKCRICDFELEENWGGKPYRKDDVNPYGLNICYDCLDKIKKYILEGKVIEK